ncbi:MAG: recombination mediator RecR [Candidatus Wallbacteria bacterium]
MAITPSLDKLSHELQKLPGIGPKSAQRLAFFIFKKGADFSRGLSCAIIDVAEKVRYCGNCFSICESELCEICESEIRDRSKICVIEKPTDVSYLESTGQFNGVYHVLNGLISPMDYLTTDKLKINELLKKVNSADSTVSELIFALPPKVEGDATIAFIKKHINRPGIKITKLAQGIPTGCEIEHLDSMTLARALCNRNAL